MITVHAVSRLTGVSIRTLQYYDKIGLLPAAAHTEAGYRLYDGASLERLQQILLFRELEFPLKDIQRILSTPGFDKAKALEQQIQFLELKKAHIENLLHLARGIQSSGGTHMHFSAFDRTKLDAYARQVKQSWGDTEAYHEFEARSQGRTSQTEEDLGRGLMLIFAEFGAIRQRPPSSDAAQALVKKLQDYITQHYYTCTHQILSSLGQMYVAGDEFTRNIDAAGGPGTAAFANKAIQIYCRTNA